MKQTISRYEETVAKMGLDYLCNLTTTDDCLKELLKSIGVIEDEMIRAKCKALIEVIKVNNKVALGA